MQLFIRVSTINVFITIEQSTASPFTHFIQYTELHSFGQPLHLKWNDIACLLNLFCLSVDCPHQLPVMRSGFFFPLSCRICSTNSRVAVDLIQHSTHVKTLPYQQHKQESHMSQQLLNRYIILMYCFHIHYLSVAIVQTPSGNDTQDINSEN